MSLVAVPPLLHHPRPQCHVSPQLHRGCFFVRCIILAVFVYFLFFVFDESGGSRGQVEDPRGEQFRWLSSQLLCPPLLDNSSQSVCTVQADVSDCVFDATAH